MGVGGEGGGGGGGSRDSSSTCSAKLEIMALQRNWLVAVALGFFARKTSTRSGEGH